MAKTIFVAFVLLALATLGTARWASAEHAYTPDVSAQVASGIKQKL